jgi:hypothetical protein
VKKPNRIQTEKNKKNRAKPEKNRAKPKNRAKLEKTGFFLKNQTEPNRK